jgi:acyl-CoA synthetase (AMP-forming)/AMP-acid ligase II
MTHPIVGAGTLVQVVAGIAAATPDKVFCQVRKEGRDRPVHYGDLVTQGLRFAGHCHAAGARPGSMVVIVLDHGPDLIYAFVGALLAGLVPSYAAPLGDRQDPTHYWDQMRLHLARLGDVVLVTSQAYAEVLAAEIGDIAVPVVTAEAIHRDMLAPAPLASPASDAIAFVQHSSGTTGARKGVALSHRAVLEQVRIYAAELRLTAADRVISWLPLYHDMGLIAGFLVPLLSGTPLVLLDPFEWVAAPQSLLAAITEHRGTLVWLPNFAFHFMARARIPAGAATDLSSVRAFVNCSEPCKKEAFDVFLDRYAAHGVTRQSLQICYAMAEMVFAVTQTPLDREVVPIAVSRSALAAGELVSPPPDEEDATSLMPVGSPLPTVQLAILDEDGKPLADRRIGEVAVSASYMASGYHREEKLTRAAWHGGWYRTGDLGVIKDGVLYITGRKKDVIIVNGKNIYAHDVEDVVNSVAGVKPGRCVCFGRPNALIGSEALYVVAESEQASDSHPAIMRAIKGAVQARMGITVTKVAIVAPKWLIKTSSGKISRKENALKYLTLTHS